MNNPKGLISVPLIVAIALVGIIGYFAFVKQTQTNTSESVSVDSPMELVKTYRNTQYGYEMQYPSFFSLNDAQLNNVSLSNTTCSSNMKLCIQGADDIEIHVSDNVDKVTLAQEYQILKRNHSSCKQVKIFPLPENFDENSLNEAVRCEVKEVPKQAKGGYDYTMVKGDKIYTVTVYQGNSTITAYINDSLTTIAKDTYDPIGDMMMRTFRFIQ